MDDECCYRRPSPWPYCITLMVMFVSLCAVYAFLEKFRPDGWNTDVMYKLGEMFLVSGGGLAGLYKLFGQDRFVERVVESKAADIKQHVETAIRDTPKVEVGKVDVTNIEVKEVPKNSQ
jgi:hypothetical protein